MIASSSLTQSNSTRIGSPCKGLTTSLQSRFDIPFLIALFGGGPFIVLLLAARQSDLHL